MHRLLVFIARFIFVPLLATAVPFLQFSFAQNIKVVKKTKIYQQQLEKDSNYSMIELKEILPDIVYDFPYATKNNFTGSKLYKDSSMTFVRLPVAKALLKVQEEL